VTRAALAVLLALAAGGCEEPCGFPGAGWLTYVTHRAGEYDVRAVREDATCDRALTSGPENETSATLSVHAGALVYWALRDGQAKVLVRDLFTGVETAVGTGALVPGSVAVSPDGAWLAFEGRLPPSKPDVYLVPLAGGAPVALAPDAADDAAPAFSADGAAVFFGSARGGSYQLWRVNADGTGAAQVTHDATAALGCGAGACPIVGGPAPSPDGRSLAFVRDQGGASRLVVLDLESGVERVLVADQNDNEPAWSPDATRLAMMESSSYGDPEIVLRDAATGAFVRRLTASPGLDGAPAFAR